MHTLIKFGIVPFDGHPLWNPSRQSVKVNTLKSNNTHITDLGVKYYFEMALQRLFKGQL